MEFIMKRMKMIGLTALLAVLITQIVIAQVGKPFIHDPSTIVECDGKYYTFGTGGGGLISEDGWTWNGGGVRPGGGAAPDAINCLLYTSDAADERSSVDLGGRRIIKKKKKKENKKKNK